MKVLDDARGYMRYYFLSCTGATDESELDPIRRADNAGAQMVDDDPRVAEGATREEQVQILELIKQAPEKVKRGYDSLSKKTRGGGELASLTGTDESSAHADGPLFDTSYGENPTLMDYVKEGGSAVVGYGGSLLARIGLLSSSRGNQYESLPGESRTQGIVNPQITSGSSYQCGQDVQYATEVSGEAGTAETQRVKVFTLE